MIITGIAQRQAWLAGRLPPAEQVAAGLWSVPVTIPDSPLRYTLAYLISTDDRVIAIDPGWDSDTGWRDLLAGLDAAGIPPGRVTGIVVTHDMRSAYTVASRIAMLFEGKVRQVGTVDEIQHTRDPVVRQFIEGKPDLDTVDAEV